MNLQGIVSVSGKPGLWRALAQNKSGYILESLDAQKVKLVANITTSKIAALNEITIFGISGDIKLSDVFERMKTAANIPDAKDDGKKLRDFFREILPDHDEDKVYASDMKKVINWYHVVKELPLFNEQDVVAPAAIENQVTVDETAKPVEAAVAEKSPVKPTIKVKKPAVKKAE